MNVDGTLTENTDGFYQLRKKRRKTIVCTFSYVR